MTACRDVTHVDGRTTVVFGVLPLMLRLELQDLKCLQTISEILDPQQIQRLNHDIHCDMTENDTGHVNAQYFLGIRIRGHDIALLVEVREAVCQPYYVVRDDAWLEFPGSSLLHSLYSTHKHVQGIIYLVSHHKLLHKIQVLLYIVVFVLQKMCEACILHSRGVM